MKTLFLLFVGLFYCAASVLHFRPKARWETLNRQLDALKTPSKDIVDLPPPSFDWRDRGVISPVMNQGPEGGAASIVIDECVESLNAIRTGKLANLSVAEVTDCCPSVSNPFDCVHKIGGLCSIEDYPRTAGGCLNGSCKPLVQIGGGKLVPTQNVEEMVNALMKTPLMASVNANQTSFAEYGSGIYSDSKCQPTVLDHVLQIVGYGEENKQPFWICKNSWGVGWGESGYIRILKGANMCGIESYVQYPY